MVVSLRYLALVAFFSIICRGDAFISHGVSRKNSPLLQRTIFRHASKQVEKSNSAQDKSDGIRTLKDIDFDAIEIPESADDILTNLISPAPESYVIINETMMRMNESTSEREFHDCIIDLKDLSHQLVKRGFAIVIERDEGDKSKWLWHTAEAEAEVKIIMKGDDRDVYAAEATWKKSMSKYQSMTVLELAHLANSQDVKETTSLKRITSHIEKRMRLTMGSDLRGRTSADAAFQLALSGVEENHQVFNSFIDVGIYELLRVGSRSSFQSKFILQMTEKFAASGIENTRMVGFYKIAGELLKAKNFRDKDLIDSLLNQRFGMHCDRPLLWLWRYSARQSKISSKVISTTNHQTYEWKSHFKHANRDLVVDVGCGMCSSLINLSTKSKLFNEEPPHPLLSDIEWEICNYAGTDLNQKFIAYGKGVLSRRGQDCRDRVHLCSVPALEFLSDLQFYPGRVKLISIHFPTPYKIDSEEGNPHLPNMEHGGFMITHEVANEISLLMKKHRSIFLFQTKCEDVAIYTKNLMSKVEKNISCVPCPNHIKSIIELYHSNNGVPQRVKKWMANIDERDIERAEGNNWSSVPLLPMFGRPETEINCEYQNTVVHRCLFQYDDNQI